MVLQSFSAEAIEISTHLGYNFPITSSVGESSVLTQLKCWVDRLNKKMNLQLYFKGSLTNVAFHSVLMARVQLHICEKRFPMRKIVECTNN